MTKHVERKLGVELGGSIDGWGTLREKRFRYLAEGTWDVEFHFDGVPEFCGEGI